MKHSGFNINNYTIHFFLITLLAFSCLLIYAFPNNITSDQTSILPLDSFSRFPPFRDGITTCLIFEIYKFVVHPPLEFINTHMRILVMLLYVASSYLLAITILKEKKYIYLFVLFLFSSRLPYLWLSRELIYGFFLCLAILAFLKKWHPVLTSILLVCLAHAKPELVLVSVAFFVVLVEQYFRQRKTCFWVVFIFVGLNFLFLLPEITNHRIGHLGDRSFDSFGQHYADLFHKHQLTPLSDSFHESKDYIKVIFPKAKTMSDIILHYPSQYYDFLFLSLAHGFKRTVFLFHILLLFVFIIFRYRRLDGGNNDLFQKLFFLSLVGYIPLILFSYPHVRYMARYYPIVIIFILSFVENFDGTKIQKKFVSGVLYAALGVNIFCFIYTLPQLTSMNYWFPD